MKFIKSILGYFIEIILAIIILYVIKDINLFLLYAFIIYLISSEKRIDYIRKLIRVYQVGNEVKLLSIIKKLKITDEEIENIFENTVTEEEKNNLDKEFNDLKKE
ncbi:MAG: hypothetical protein HOE80_03400 [Candidatus Magasanikbacteria bacterium]|jgi:hypothetical protein|nr:hypothetical protein [Candidatus Magasanikbacteria bacterium]MBT4071743.1 hypothetical protein [Candidatus Magasanikbacteria bacterium]